jgi:hypothetical protein
MYSPTLPLTSALDGGGCSAPRPGRFTPRERPGNHCTGEWVGPMTVLGGCRKSRHHRDSIPGPPSPQRVAIRTELPPPPPLPVFHEAVILFSAANPLRLKTHTLQQ